MTRFARFPERSISDSSVFDALKNAGFFETKETKPLYNLILITTSDCNLKCQYCFANA
jgi:sulfatase maturation enzyme AslB (radical SAM superfamily)